MDANGRYSVLLGANSKDGIPAELFTSNEARWLGVQVEQEAEQPRVLLVSVPYALKAGDAETLGGKPLSAFVMAQPTTTTTSSTTASTTASTTGSTTTATKSSARLGTTPNTVSNPTPSATGATNFVAKFDASSNLINSSIFDNGFVGIGTATPAFNLDVLGGIQAQAASFPQINFKQTGGGGSVAQEWRYQINPDGSYRIYDITGGVVPRFVMTQAGSVGIGTASPAFNLDVVGGMQAQSSQFPQINFKQTGGGGSVAQEWRYQINPDGSYRIYDITGGIVPRFVLTQAGKIGIGTDTPGFNLDVVGGIQAQAGSFPQINFKQTGGGGSTAQEYRYQINPDGSYHIYDITSGTLSRFVLTQAGNIGIGNDAPGQKLSVGGVIESLSGGFKFPDGSVQASANAFTASTSDQVLRVVQNGAGAGSLTLGTLPSAVRGDATATSGFISGVLGTSTSPDGFGVTGLNLAASGNAIGVFGVSTQSTAGTGIWGEAEATSGDAIGVFGKSYSTTGTGVVGYVNVGTGDAVGVYGRSDSILGTGVLGEAVATSGNTYGVWGRTASYAGYAGVFDNTASGTILVGRSGVNATNVFRVDGNGKGYFNGGTQTGGADFAESVDVVGTAAQYEPGDVLIIDTTGERRLALSRSPYSSLVAGIYSTKPGVLATPHNMDDPRLAAEVPLAIIGIVPCKVTTENGPIETGDLLVTSSMPGHAMKGTVRKRMLGAVVGKALQPLQNGTGIIQVLVALH